MKYNLICGLEIHTELKTQSKMFCGCKNDPFGAKEPNIYTCPVCLGMPGALPVANRRAIEWTVKLGLFLDCQINLKSKFDRKNYFYPDLPKGYQISQYDLPFCFDGKVETDSGVVRINRIHLEEDTAKLLHQIVEGKKVTLIDFNRSSVPLVEIVTEPDIKTSEQAVVYAKKIREAVRLLGIGEADMQKGAMRLEANISLQTKEQAERGELPNYKVEVKNINSFNFMKQAIEYEMKRQAALLDQGVVIKQETRGWNSEKGETFLQRSKENAADYRYFPDPDLPMIVLSQAQIDKWQAELPLSSEQEVKRWEKQYQIPVKYGQALIGKKEEIAWANELWQAAAQQNLSVAKLANYLVNKKINYSLNDKVVEVIKKFSQLTQVDEIDQGDLKAMIKKTIGKFPAEVKRYQAGEKQLLGFFMGQIIKSAGKKLDAAQVSKILREELG